MYIWSHGFEMMNTQRLDVRGNNGKGELGYFQSIGMSDQATGRGSTVKAGKGAGWFFQQGIDALIHMVSPTVSEAKPFISIKASRTPHWGNKGPHGRYGCILYQPGQTVGPKDCVTPYKLNAQGVGGHGSGTGKGLQDFAVSIDMYFDEGLELQKNPRIGNTTAPDHVGGPGLLRLSTQASSAADTYPNMSNYFTTRVDVNADQKLTLEILDGTSTLTYAIVDTSTNTVPKGRWFRITARCVWNSAAGYTSDVYIDGVKWLSGTVASDSSLPSRKHQGFLVGYVGKPTAYNKFDIPYAQKIDNAVVLVEPTIEELKKQYFCVPIFPAHVADARDVIKNGDGSSVYQLAPTSTFTPTKFAEALVPQLGQETSSEYRPYSAMMAEPNSNDLVFAIRPRLPQFAFGTKYDPNAIDVHGITMTVAYGPPRDTTAGESPVAYYKQDAGRQYFMSPGWRTLSQNRINEEWPASSDGSNEGEGLGANMWWCSSAYKQVAGLTSWENYGSPDQYTKFSWKDDIEKGAIPMVIKAGISPADTMWGFFGMYMDTCISVDPHMNHDGNEWSNKPNAQIIVKDTLFDKDKVVVPLPSEHSPYMANPYAAATNKGNLLPFMDGFWDESIESQYGKPEDIVLKVTETGSLGYDACFAWKFASEADSSYRSYMDRDMHYGHHNPFAFLNSTQPGFSDWGVDDNYNHTEDMGKKSAHCVGYSTQHNRLLVFWWNANKKAYAIAYRNMSTELRANTVLEAGKGPYKFQKFDGGYTQGKFPDNKLVDEHCPYVQCVELLDGTMRFFHCYRDILKPVTDGFQPFLQHSFTTGFYNIDMYTSLDGGLTWELTKERLLDEPFGDSRAIRHFSAAADGQWMRMDFCFYDTIFPGPALDFETYGFGGYWMPGRLGCSSGDGGATWSIVRTVNGSNPDGYDHSVGDNGSGIHKASSNWSIPKYSFRTDELAQICGSGRNDGTFWRWRSTYNQDQSEGGSSNVSRWGKLKGWFIGKSLVTSTQNKLTQQLTLGVFETSARGDEWGLISTPQFDGEHSIEYVGPRAFTFGITSLYAVGTPQGSYFGQIYSGDELGGGALPIGGHWGGRFSWFSPNQDPYNYPNESNAGTEGFINDYTGSWSAAAKSQYEPSFELYMAGRVTSAEMFDSAGLAQDNQGAWGSNAVSIDATWAGDRVVLANAQGFVPCLFPDEGTTQKMLSNYGMPIWDRQVPPVVVSYKGGWEKQALRRTQHPSNFYKPQIWRADWNATSGFPAGDVRTGTSHFPGAGTVPFASVPASTPALFLLPVCGLPALGPWQIASLADGNFRTQNDRFRCSTIMRYWADSGGRDATFSFFQHEAYSTITSATNIGTSQLIGEGGLIDMGVYLHEGHYPYRLSAGHIEDTSHFAHGGYAQPGRGFVVETARNNQLIGGSTVQIGVAFFATAPAATMSSDPTNSDYWGTFRLMECVYDAASVTSVPTRTMYTHLIQPPADTLEHVHPIPYNVRVGFVDGFTLSPATTYTYCRVQWRKLHSNDDWVSSPLLTCYGSLGTTSFTEQRVKWGMVNMPKSQHTEYHNEWVHFKYARGREGHMGVGLLGAAESGRGAICSPFSSGVTQGIRARWGGNATFAGDTFTSPVRFINGVDQLRSDSPQMYWRSIGALTEMITFDARAGEDTAHMYFRHNAIGLFNVNARKVHVSYGPNTDFSSIQTTFTVDATRYSDVVVASLEADGTRVDAVSARQWGQNELAGMYAEVWNPAGAGSSHVFKIKSNRDNYIQFEPKETALLNYVDMWSTINIYADNAVHFFKNEQGGQIGRCIRLEFPRGDSSHPLGPPEPIEGHWKLGAFVPGMTVGFEVPLDWEDQSSTSPNVILNTMESGVRTAYKQGQARETYKGSLAGSDIGKFRGTLKSTLEQITEFSLRPMVVCINDDDPNKNSLYARWTGDVTLKNEGYRYNSDTSKWEKIGTLEVEFEEEV